MTGEGYLNFARRLVAQERNRHIGEFKPAFVRAASGAPNELLPFLHELAGIDGLITEFLELAADCESRPKDSNSEMSPQIIPLKARTDSPGPSQSSGHRDYSRLSCGAGDTQLGPSAGISADILARALVINNDGATATHQHCMAVGFRAYDHFVGDVGAAAWPVLDQDLLAPAF